MPHTCSVTKLRVLWFASAALSFIAITGWLLGLGSVDTGESARLELGGVAVEQTETVDPTTGNVRLRVLLVVSRSRSSSH